MTPNLRLAETLKRSVRREGLSVFVRALELQAAIGVHAHEMGRTQPLIVSIELDLDPAPVEGLEDTVDYETLAEAARGLIADGHIGLVEEFAERLARLCLGAPRARSVRVRVEKPQALAGAEAAGCEVALTLD